MAELTLEQKKALARARARASAGGGAQPAQETSYFQMAGDLASRANPAAYLAQSLVDSVVKDVRGDPKKDARDSTMGKIDAAIRGMADTMSFGLADEIAAGGDTLINGDSYEKNLARQRSVDDADYENRFSQRLQGQIAGGVTQGAGLVKNGVSLTANAVKAGKSLPKVMGYGAVESGTLGTLQGLGSGTDTEDRINKGVTGGLISSVLGGATPAVISGAKALLQPAMSYFQPDAAKDRIMAALLKRAGMTADDVAARLQGASDDGQGIFMAADALENPGQRVMSTAARTPNDVRKMVVDSLLARQMDQGRRVAGALEDASGTRLTADQTRQLMMQSRSEEAARNYAPVRNETTPINVTPVISEANRRISPIAEVRSAARGDVPTDLASRADIEAAEATIRDPIRQSLKEARSFLASDSLTVTNVEKAFRAKNNIDAMINKATENGQGAMVEELLAVQQQLDDALARTSPQYSAARDSYRTASNRIDAIDTGADMAKGRRRVEDNLTTFGALPDDESRQAARIGYFDPKIAKAESTIGTTTDASRPYISEAMRRELPEIAAPGEGDRLMRRLSRENTMAETTRQALGGSRTADNLADASDSGVDPGVIAALLSGRFKDAAMSAMTQTANAAKGMPPNVVERLIPALMETNPQAARDAFSASAQNMKISDETRARIIAALLGSGATVPGRLSP